MSGYNWQQTGWPKATVNRAVLRDELKSFEAAFKALKKELRKPQDMEVVVRALTDEAVKTSAIEGVNVDESVVMSSICKALGVAYAPKGFTKDARAEGVAQMMLALREKWNASLTAKLLTNLHGALMKGEETRVAVGAFRSHKEPMRVIRRHADGTVEIRYEAPPSERVPKEIAAFVKIWKTLPQKPSDIALKAAMLHPHFESIHPFEDGNGRVGRARREDDRRRTRSAADSAGLDGHRAASLGVLRRDQRGVAFPGLDQLGGVLHSRADGDDDFVRRGDGFREGETRLSCEIRGKFHGTGEEGYSAHL